MNSLRYTITSLKSLSVSLSSVLGCPPPPPPPTPPTVTFLKAFKSLYTKLLIDFCKEKSRKLIKHCRRRPVKNWWKQLQREGTVFFLPQLEKFNSMMPSYQKHSDQFFISAKRRKHGTKQPLCCSRRFVKKGHCYLTARSPDQIPQVH